MDTQDVVDLENNLVTLMQTVEFRFIEVVIDHAAQPAILSLGDFYPKLLSRR